MSKNILEKILKLSYSEKEYFNLNFNKIASILDIKIAGEENQAIEQNVVPIEQPVQTPLTPSLAPASTPSPVLQNTQQDIANLSKSIDLISNILLNKSYLNSNGKRINFIDAIKEYENSKDENLLDEITDGMLSIKEIEIELKKHDESIYDLSEEIFRSVIQKSSNTSDLSNVKEPSQIEKDFNKKEDEFKKIEEFTKSFENTFGKTEGIDTSPIGEIMNLINNTLAEEFYKKDSESATFIIIFNLNKILRSKYNKYQSEFIAKKDISSGGYDPKKTFDYYRDLERKFPEFLLKREDELSKSKELNKEESELKNEFRESWLDIISENNADFQEQVDAALEQRAFFESGGISGKSGRSEGSENYNKAANFCRKCKQFWGSGAAPIGSVNQSEEIRKTICRNEKFGETIDKNGEVLIKEGCKIVKNLLQKTNKPDGGVPELFGADRPLSVNFGEDFFNISTGDLEYLSSSAKEERKALLVTEGHMNNINTTVAEFLKKADSLNIFGSREENQREYINRLYKFKDDVKTFIETFHYFFPSFFAPKSSEFKEKIYEDSEGTKSKSKRDEEDFRRQATLAYDSALGSLSEIFGKAYAAERGISPNTVGSFSDGTLNVDITALSDLWNMVSYFPNLSSLGKGTEGPKSTYLREKGMTLPYADEEVSIKDSKSALAYPHVLARSAAELKILNDYIEKILGKMVKDAISSGILKPKIDRRKYMNKGPEEVKKMDAVNLRIEEEIAQFRIKLIENTLRAREIRFDADNKVIMEGDERTISKEEKVMYMPGLNIINEIDLIEVIDNLIRDLNINSEAIFRDPDNLNYFCSTKVISEKYQKMRRAVEELGYEDAETKEIIKAVENDVDISKAVNTFGEKTNKSNSEVRDFIRREGNTYPEYVEISNKILTLPKELVSHLTSSLSVIPIRKEVPVIDENGDPIFFASFNGTEENVIPNYEKKQFERSDGSAIDASLVSHRKRQLDEVPGIIDTVLANPKARQAIAMICLGYAMRNKENANPSKIYSLMANATDGGVLPHSETGGAYVFSEDRRLVKDPSIRRPPLFIDFLMKSGAKIGNTFISSFYDKMQHMGIFSPGKTQGDKQRNVELDKPAYSNSWYKVAKALGKEKKYNYVIVTTKYDIKLMGGDLIRKSISGSNMNIPFFSIVPFSNFGSIKNVVEFSTDLENPYMAVAVSEDVELLMKAAGFWPIKNKTEVPQEFNNG